MTSAVVIGKQLVTYYGEPIVTFAARFFSPFRLASYVLVFYAYAHTMGAVIKVPRFGAASDQVVAAMQSVQVQVMGATCTWYDFYRGFGYFVGFFLLFAAYLAWLCGGMTESTRPVLLKVGWGLLVVNVTCLPLVFIYFFAAPMACQALVTALLAVGSVIESRRASPR